MPIFQAEKIRQVILKAAGAKYLIMKLMTKLSIQPGQYVLVDGHPFTVASIVYNENNTKNLTFVVEVKGPWTQRLRGSIPQGGMQVHIQGGYGGALNIKQRAVLVGTGTGFSGPLCMVESITRQVDRAFREQNKIVLLGQMKLELFKIYAPLLLEVITSERSHEWLTVRIFVSDNVMLQENTLTDIVRQSLKDSAVLTDRNVADELLEIELVQIIGEKKYVEKDDFVQALGEVVPASDATSPCKTVSVCFQGSQPTVREKLELALHEARLNNVNVHFPCVMEEYSGGI